MPDIRPPTAGSPWRRPAYFLGATLAGVTLGVAAGMAISAATAFLLLANSGAAVAGGGEGVEGLIILWACFGVAGGAVGGTLGGSAGWRRANRRWPPAARLPIPPPEWRISFWMVLAVGAIGLAMLFCGGLVWR